MIIRSPKFHHGGKIPGKYCCWGKNISPPLEFDDIPANAKSLVLLIEDTDASPTPWIHWLVFNIPPYVKSVDEGTIPEGGIEGIANGGTFGYEGPCPKYFKGIHHYLFKLYALDSFLDLPRQTDKKHLWGKMGNYIISKTELMGIAVSDAV